MTFLSAVKLTETALVRICRLFSALGGVSLLFMTGVTAVDVVGRNFFGSPLKGALEIVSVGLVLTLFWACLIRRPKTNTSG